MNKTIIQSTAFGQVVVLWSMFRGRPTVTRVILSQPGLSAVERASQLSPEADASCCPEIDSACTDIAASLGGRKIRFPLSLAQLHACPPFQQAVLRADHAIPRGKISTYGLVASHLGKPGAARAVGNALANNPFPIIIPCHRVIRSDRTLGGYRGGPPMKRALLESEGIAFDSAGKAQLESLHYDAIGRENRIENTQGSTS
ncbi:MAG: MGMT family protein [Lentisphaerae bacterium]|nr:MGMT family protein [Lentisphaerota bacterium]